MCIICVIVNTQYTKHLDDAELLLPCKHLGSDCQRGLMSAEPDRWLEDQHCTDCVPLTFGTDVKPFCCHSKRKIGFKNCRLIYRAVYESQHLNPSFVYQQKA